MRLKTLYTRFYKSFNYDYLRKSDSRAVGDPWDTVDQVDDRFFPFVAIPLEADITTVVGANESGKSQIIAAIKCLLTGSNIRRRDFCRYSDLLTVNKEMSLPEFGGEFTDLSETEKSTVTNLLGVKSEQGIESFWFFRFNKRVTIYGAPSGAEVDAVNPWTSKTLSEAQLKRLSLPTFFEIHADIPLPSSVSLEYLTSPKSKKRALSREGRLGFFRSLFDDASVFASKESVAIAAPGMVSGYASYAKQVDDKDLSARLELAEKLLFQVGKIDKSAFEELQNAVQSGQGSEGWANGLVRKINAQLADALNFTKWWSQDADFSLYLTLRDFDLIFTVQDRTGQEYSFNERSSGMSYFLSYFVQYLSHEPSGGQEILLMDEPDTYLSMQGQQDLMRIFGDFASPEDASKSPVQVLYVTHSPFLIDKNHGERIRVLEKGEGEEGTRVVENAAKNHYEPLRSAFGAFVAETTFIGNCNLMIEGQADQVLLAGISSLARRLGTKDVTLDLNSLTLVPAGGAEHIPYMVYLARGRDVDKPAVIVLLDSDDEGTRQVKELKKGYRDKKLLDDDFIVQVGDLDGDSLSLSVPLAQEIEDLIPSDVMLLAVKHFAAEVLSPKAFAALDSQLTSIEPLGNEKLFKAAERSAFEASPDKERPLTLDKVGVARGVLVVLEKEAGPELRDQTFGNFHVLFRRLDKAQRDATRRKASDLTRSNLKDLRTRFKRDHRAMAVRRDADDFLDDMLDQVRDSSVAAETVRDMIRRIRIDFKLDVDPATQVDDFDSFLAAIDEVINRPTIDAQSS